MQAALSQYFDWFGIGIAVTAKMFTSIISTDVAAEVTGTLGARTRLFGGIQVFADGFFVITDCAYNRHSQRQMPRARPLRRTV